MREGGGPSPARDGSAASHLEGLTLFMYADHLLPLVGEMLPQEEAKDNKPGRALGVRASASAEADPRGRTGGERPGTSEPTRGR
jgi:hypothetical protein